MATLQTLAAYLAADIDVVSPAWGRGRLLGLPYVQPWDRKPDNAMADVYYEFPPPDAISSGVHEVGRLKPVLYAPEDWKAVVKAAPKSDALDKWWLTRFDLDELTEMAQLVDMARALGIALNLSPTDYIRKELPV